MPSRQLELQVLEAIGRRGSNEHDQSVAPRKLIKELRTPASTLRRAFQRLVKRGVLQRRGKGSAIRYVLQKGVPGPALATRPPAKDALVLRQAPMCNARVVKFRPRLIEAVQAVVYHRRSLLSALEALALSPDERHQFEPFLRTELEGLHEFNAARFDLGARTVDAWIAEGRPL